MSRHQDHPLRIHLVAPTGTRNWLGAAYCAIMLVVGCAKLERRDAVVALLAHATALLAASLDLTPGLTWKGVGPEQRQNMHPWLRRWMSTIAPFGLVLPLISAPWSPPARAHAILLMVQIFGERVSAALEWNAVAAYVAPVLLTAYRVHASALWFAVARSPERALAMINVFLWGVNLFYVLGYANVLPLVASRSSSPPCAPRPIRPSRDNFCGELRPRRRRRLSARLMRILSGEPTPAEQLATYNDTRQIFAD